MFTDADRAIDRYDETDEESVAARKEALSKLAQFVNQSSDDPFTEMARQELLEEYKDSKAMQAIDEHDTTLDDVYAKLSEITTITDEEEQSLDGTPVDDIDGIYTGPTKRVTTDMDLTDENRELLNYAIAYSSSHMIPLDELPEAVTTEEFQEYVKQLNKELGREDNPVVADPVEAKKLVRAAINTYNQLKDDERKDAEEKAEEIKSTKPAKSVVTPPVVPGKSDEEEEKKPEPKPESKPESKPEPASDDNKPQEEPAGDLSDVPENLQIGVANLLDEIDNLDLSNIAKDERDDLRKELKRKILKLASKGKFTSFRHFLNTFSFQFRSQSSSPARKTVAMKLSKLKIDTRKRTKKTDDPDFIPFELETLDIDVLRKYEYLNNYVDAHNIEGFFNIIANKWHEERAKGKKIDVPVMFVYDKRLDDKTKESLGDSYTEKKIPIVLVVPLTDDIKQRFGIDEKDNRLLDMGNNDPVEHGRKYIPIGIMPADDNPVLPSSRRMEPIRKNWNRGSVQNADSNCHLLRYEPQKKTYENGVLKQNGPVIASTITTMNASDAPESNAETGLNEFSALGDLGVNNPSASVVGDMSEKDKSEYNEAKEKAADSNNKGILRATQLYKDIREAIRKKFYKDDSDPKKPVLRFEVVKGSRALRGTKGEFNPRVMAKRITDTMHRDRPNDAASNIGKLIEAFDINNNDNSNEVIGNGEGDNGANSRLTGLYIALKNLLEAKNNPDIPDISSVIENCFDDDGGLMQSAEKEYKKAMQDLGKLIMKKIDNYLNIAENPQVNVSIDQSNPKGEKTMTITVNNNSGTLASVTIDANGEFEKKHLMSLLKQCIFDEDMDVRTHMVNDKVYDVVKWQIPFNTIISDQPADINTTNDLYDDGIMTVRLNKLTSKAKSVTVQINPIMKNRLYNEKPGAKPTPPPSLPRHHSRAGNGDDVDPDSGAVIKDVSAADITTDERDPRIPEATFGKLRQLVKDSESRVLVDGDKYYAVNGTRRARVTSIKRFFAKSKSEEWDETSPYGLPATRIGNSLDDFGRHTYNNVFDNMKEEERLIAFDAMPNSTRENYQQVYTDLKRLQAHLASIGQTILAVGDANNPGKITVSGEIPVKMIDGSTKMLGIAGTVDILAVDRDGNVHIYDFKTYRSGEMNKEKADKDDYDIQLNLYAKFLEKEYGLKVASINIIPVKVSYDPIKSQFIQEDETSNQLSVKDKTDTEFRDFRGAGFKVGKPEDIVNLDFMSDEDLTIKLDNLTEKDKHTAEALADQYNQPTRPEDLGDPDQPAEDDILEPDETFDDIPGLTDEDLLNELNDISMSDARRSALEAEYEKRDKLYESLTEQFPKGTEVQYSGFKYNFDTTGTVTGEMQVIDGIYHMMVQFGDEIVPIKLSTAGDVLTLAHTEGPADNNQRDEQIDDNSFDPDTYYELEDEDEDSDDNRPPNVPDSRVTDDLARSNGDQTSLEEHEDQCRR